jgi:FkbM family methyltransferase
MKLNKKKFDGFSLYLDANNVGISGNLNLLGWWEPGFSWMLLKEADGIAIEVGASVGYFTMLLCSVCDQVIVFEPDKRSRKILKKNIELNNYQDKVILHSSALSDSKGKKNIYLAKKPNQSSFIDSNKTFSTEMIKTQTIDDIDVLPSFIKMDIEGYEIEVISGAINTLENSSKCKILMEVHPITYSEGRSFENILKRLIDMGFYFKYIESAAVAIPDLFAENGYEPFKVFDCGGGFKRGIYQNIKPDDGILFSSKVHEQYIPSLKKTSKKIVRSILLAKDNK